MDFTIDKETALVEFNRFVSAMDLSVNETDMDNDDKKDFRLQKDRVVHAIMRGALVVNESGECVFTPTRVEDAKPITFYEPRGSALYAMDRKSKGADIGKFYAAMADITKTSVKTFSDMRMVDLNVCMAITTLFLA